MPRGGLRKQDKYLTVWIFDTKQGNEYKVMCPAFDQKLISVTVYIREIHFPHESWELMHLDKWYSVGCGNKNLYSKKNPTGSGGTRGIRVTWPRKRTLRQTPRQQIKPSSVLSSLFDSSQRQLLFSILRHLIPNAHKYLDTYNAKSNIDWISSVSPVGNQGPVYQQI
jgi:hypothetical protein